MHGRSVCHLVLSRFGLRPSQITTITILSILQNTFNLLKMMVDRCVSVTLHFLNNTLHFVKLLFCCIYELGLCDYHKKENLTITPHVDAQPVCTRCYVIFHFTVSLPHVWGKWKFREHGRWNTICTIRQNNFCTSLRTKYLKIYVSYLAQNFMKNS